MGRVSVLENEKSSGDGCWLHNKVNVLNTTELLNMINFTLCIFHHY